MLLKLISIYICTQGGVTGFLGSLKIIFCEERRLEDTLNLKCEDRRFQNCLVLTTDDLATKLEDWRFKFLTGKIWFLSVINWEDRSWWYLPHTAKTYHAGCLWYLDSVMHIQAIITVSYAYLKIVTSCFSDLTLRHLHRLKTKCPAVFKSLWLSSDIVCHLIVYIEFW